MVDSSDVERIGITREEFHAILEEDELKDALILVYANKQVGTLHSKDKNLTSAATAWPSATG